MLQAFQNDKKLKTKYLKRVKAHYDADEIVQGVYWENGKGCAVGCTLEYNNQGGGNIHQMMEDQLGVPRILARLEDRIFEGLTNGEAKKFPLQFLKAINVGADLSLVWPKFAIWLLVDKKDGVIKYARPDGKKAIQAVADTYTRLINGEKIDVNEWLEKRRAAAAAAYADDAAAAADAADAAYAAAAYAVVAAYAAAAYAVVAADAAAAAYAAYAAAADAADADAADAADAAKTEHYKKMADKLIELLKEAK